MARRIVTYARKGEEASVDEHLGFIKFGSRVDIYLPVDCEILVKLATSPEGCHTRRQIQIMNAIVKNIPNSITCLNITAGSIAIIFALQGNSEIYGMAAYNWAYIFIGIAAVMDFSRRLRRPLAACLFRTWQRT